MYLVKTQNTTNVSSSYKAEALLNFMTVAAFAIIAPAVALSNSMGHIWPTVLMATVVAAGTVLGLVIHEQPDRDTVVQIPFTHVPNVPRSGTGPNLKKAA